MTKLQASPKVSKVILWGGTGQAKVDRPILESSGIRVVAVFDDTPGLVSPFSDVDVYCGWESFMKWINQQPTRKEIGFCVSIGNPHGRTRLKLQERLKGEGLVPVPVVHPSAIIADSVRFGEGVQIMAGVVIQPETQIGDQCIINTGARLDHENILGNGVEIGPGAILCGCIRVETNGWIAAGAVILPRITIGHDSIVGAGSLVTKDIPSQVVAYGSPARIVRKTGA